MVAVGVLAAPFATLGARIFGLVLGYNLALPFVARLLGHRDWFELWLFLVPLSALQIVPDWVLSARLGVLVFPDTGGPRIDTVSAAMAGMWTIALFPVVYLGRRIEARRGYRAALGAVVAASFVVFVGSEAVAWRIPIWYAQNVAMVGHVALYVVIPELLLGLAAFQVFRASTSHSHSHRLVGAVALMFLYLAALICCFVLIERVFGL